MENTDELINNNNDNTSKKTKKKESELLEKCKSENLYSKECNSFLLDYEKMNNE